MITFVNLEYHCDEQFPSLESALNYGRRCHYEFSVWRGVSSAPDSTWTQVAWWSPIGGTRYY